MCSIIVQNVKIFMRRAFIQANQVFAITVSQSYILVIFRNFGGRGNKISQESKSKEDIPKFSPDLNKVIIRDIFKAEMVALSTFFKELEQK